MREQDNYWARRVRRRRILGGAAVMGVGAASLALVGCGDDDDEPSPTQPSTGGTTAPGTSPTTGGAASPTTAPVQTKQKGGIARFTSANNTYDTFDADRTRFGPMGTMFGLTMQGVVQWESFAESKISGYFAESYEQPDDSTYTFKVREGLTWHDKPPVNGRAANAQDIVFHIERNKAGLLKDGTPDPNFYRKDPFSVVESASAVDERTVTVKMARPTPFFLNTLAGTWTKVQAPEAVDQFEADYTKFSADLIIGTGDFVLTDFQNDGTLSFRRAPNPSREVWWDGVDYVPLFTDAAAQQAAFEQKQIDAFAPAQKAVLDDLKARMANNIYEKAIFAGNPVTGTYYGGAAPWSDQRLIGAIYQVLDRRGLIQQLLQGRGAMTHYIPPGWAPYALPESELVTLPGYLEDREADYKDAKAKWDAAGGPNIGPVIIDIPDIYEGANSGVSALITNHLKTVLGGEFEARLEPYATITSKLVGQKYGNGTNNIWIGWSNPPDDPDPSSTLIRLFQSSGNAYKQFEVPLPGMDDLLAKLAVEYDSQKRIEMNHEATRILAAHWGGGYLPVYLQISNILYWNYYHIGESTHFVTSHNTGRDNWFDQTDPTWQGRQA